MSRSQYQTHANGKVIRRPDGKPKHHKSPVPFYHRRMEFTVVSAWRNRLKDMLRMMQRQAFA